jgi:hypothetical protein
VRQLTVPNGSSEFDAFLSLYDVQMQTIGGDIPLLPSVLAVLTRHGLIARRAAGGGPTYEGSPASTQWFLTEFGREVHDRIVQVGQVVVGMVAQS